jgi:hypothetical protein
MDGMQMMLSRLLTMLGIDPTVVEQLRESIPKLQQGVPAFAQNVEAKVNEIHSIMLNLQFTQAEQSARLSSIEKSVESIEMGLMHGEGPASEALPPDPFEKLLSEETN